jgi:glutamine amidotransferase-like uncharacterized protein
VTYHEIVKRGREYFIKTRAQASRRVFLTPAGRTIEEAQAFLKALAVSEREPDWRLFGDYCHAVDEDAIWERAADFRAAETRAFRACRRMVVYTDSPESFARVKNGVGSTLRRIGFAFETVSTEDIRAGALASAAVVVFPGGFGYFPDRALSARIRDFVRQGGGFVGFCAGAFLALRDSCGVKGACLGLLDATYRYFREKGLSLVDVAAADPLASGVVASAKTPVYALYKRPAQARRHNIRISMMRGNGPLILAGSAARVVGYYDGSEPYAAIVRGAYSKGRVVAFSAHPEVCLETARMASEADAVEGAKLVKNAILYCGRI